MFSLTKLVLGVFWTSALLSFLTPASASDRLTVPVFHEETASSGIISIYAGDWQYMVGGGVAAFDCNGDGYPDLAIAGGEGKSSLFINTSARAGLLTFSKAVSGLELDHVTGLYPLDIDGDGIMDLVVLRVGEALLMRGLGGCTFERANEKWHFDGGNAWWTSFSATWEKGSSWPTLALGAYIDPQSEANPWGSCTDNHLYRPIAEGKGFEEPFALKPSYCALSMLFTDWNRSGVPALRVSNDREYYEGGQEQLWHVDPGEPPRLYTDSEGWKFLKIWGMGIASTTFPNDVYPSYFLTSMSDNKLQMLQQPNKETPRLPVYKDLAFDRGVVAYRPYTGEDLKPSTAWHAQFEDVNNDGLPDLFIAKGNVDRMPDFAQKDPNNLLLQRPDGTFIEVGDISGVASTLNSRGAALADFNLDGKIDLLVVNRRDNAQIWQNETPDAGNFVEIMLHQEGPNRDAIGAWLEVDNGDHIMRREITIGGGHASGQLGWHHFGVGSAQSVKIRTIWPDGKAGEWETLASNAFYSVSHGQPAKAWHAGTSP
jgi:hypothetical protein